MREALTQLLQILVATWCENERDLEVVWKMLTQLTAAYQPLGGRCVVVLSAREKLNMEGLFRRVRILPKFLNSHAASQVAC